MTKPQVPGQPHHHPRQAKPQAVTHTAPDTNSSKPHHHPTKHGGGRGSPSVATHHISLGLAHSSRGPLCRIMAPSLLQRQVAAVLHLQSLRSPLMRLLGWVSWLGSGKVVLMLISLWWWVGDGQLGWRPQEAASVMLVVVGIIKNWFKGPRPYWLNDKVLHLDPTLETSFGFPSGHTVAMCLMYGLFACHFVSTTLSSPSPSPGLATSIGVPLTAAAFIITVVLVGVSRVYTGAHFVHDVVGGVLLGFILLLLELASAALVPQIRGAHTGSVPGAIFLTLVAFCGIASVAATSKGSERVPRSVVYEAIAGVGFSLGVVFSHIGELTMGPIPCHWWPLGWVGCVAGVAGTLVSNAVFVKRLPESSDGTLTFKGLCCVTFGYFAIQFWSTFCVPRLFARCP